MADTIHVQYLEVAEPAQRTVLVEQSLALPGLTHFTLAFSVGPFSTGDVRTVSVQVVDASGAYQEIGSAIDVQTSTALEDEVYFLAAVHSGAGLSRNVTGPNHIRNSIKYNKDPPGSTCAANEMLLAVYPSTPYVSTCVQLRTLSDILTANKIHWFQFASSTTVSAQLKSFSLQPFKFYLSYNNEVTAQVSSAAPAKYILVHVETTAGSDDYSLNLIDKNGCEYSSPSDCISGEVVLASQNMNTATLDLFDGNPHTYEVVKTIS